MKNVLRTFPVCAALTFCFWLASAVRANADSTSNRPETAVAQKGLAPSDWAGIRAAYEAGRHAVQRLEDGTSTARNPNQQWRTRFDGRGFLTTPDAGGWQWGLQLQSYGFAGHEHAITQTTANSITGNRLTYAWDAALEEWFVNDTRGLEHGFTVRHRPAGGEENGDLHFTLAVRGGLRPEVLADGQGVRFTDANGGAVLTYAGLKVWDGDGKTLGSRFEPAAAGTLRLTVYATAASYPITIDPIAQQAYLKASNTESDDNFGESVAISGDTIIVGAPNEDSNGVGVNGVSNNNSANSSGAAYVFVRANGVWTQQAYLKAPNTGAGDDFGYRVGISGDTVVISAPFENGGAIGVNNGFNNLTFDAGAAYVYVRKSGVWSFEAYLKASNTGVSDHFGRSVSVSGNTIVVGAANEDGGGTGVNPASTETATDSGSAYVFVRDGTTWTQQAYLKASNTGSTDHFGWASAVDGNTIVIGAIDEDGGGTGTNPPSDEAAGDAGAVYVFVRNGSTWAQQAYLKASNTGSGDSFGNSVEISGNTLISGAPFEDGSGNGINPPSNNNNNDAGAAYIFERTGTIWTEQAYIKANNSETGDDFGRRLDLDGDIAVIGGHLENGSGSGVNPPGDNGVADAGAAYVFVRSANIWSQQAYLKASNTGFDDSFGWDVAVSGGTVVVTAAREDGGGTGINPASNENASNSGAAYVFTDLGFSKISVEQPPASIITNGGSRDLGIMSIGNTKSVSFTIKNNGTAELTGLTTSFTGDNASSFSIGTAPIAPVAASGGNTTFTVQFSPSGSGAHSAILHIASNDPLQNPFDIQLTATGTIPDIAVDQPGGINLTDEVSTVDFGNVLTGTNTSLTFTIKNTGAGELTGLTITDDGTDHADFSITKNPAAPVIGPSGTTTFTVKFAPGGAGTRTAALHITSNDPDESPFDINLTGFCTAPEIAVETSLGDLTDNVSVVSFDGVLTGGGQANIVFTVKNGGDGNLTGLTITKNGTHASQYSIVANATAPVAPAGSTTFTVRFTPTSAGDKTAAIHIASNDSNENPFDINLTGFGITPIPPIVKTLPALSVTHNAAMLHGTVDAKGLLREATFQYGLTTSYGAEVAASPAYVSDPSPTATPVSFALTGLLPHTKYNFRAKASGYYGAAAGANQSFTTLDREPECAADTYLIIPGAKATLAVLGNDTDPDNDVLSIASFSALNPKTAGKLAKSGSTLIFTAAAGFTGSATFSYTATDGFGKSDSAAVSLTVGGSCTLDPLSSHFNAGGGVGGINVATTPADCAWSVTENLSWVIINELSGTGAGGFSVTVLPNATKVARSGLITVGNATHEISQSEVMTPDITDPGTPPPALISAPYSFLIPTTGAPFKYAASGMPPGLKLDYATQKITGVPTKKGTYHVSIKASNAAGSDTLPTFDITVDELPAEVVGTFQGFIARDPVLNANLGSRLELTTTLTGACSGKIITGTTALAFKGQLKADAEDDDHPELVIDIPRKGSATPWTLDLDLQPVAANTFEGIFKDNLGASVQAAGWRKTWTATHKASDYNLVLHTFSLEQPDDSVALPQGYGYGAFTVKDTTGALTVSGKLADGSNLTTSTFVGPQGQVLLYQSLYANKGSLTGVLSITHGGALNENNTVGVAQTVAWFKPAALSTSKDRIYKEGFGPINLTAEGAAYVPPLKGAIVMGLLPPVDNDNAMLSFSAGDLPTDFSVDLGLFNPSVTSLANKATVPVNTNTVTLPTITASTGLFNGGFLIATNPSTLNRKVTFQGRIVKHSDGIRGYGFFLMSELPDADGEKLTTTPTHSGKVILSEP